MKLDILEQLYYGKIIPWEKNHEKSPRAKELIAKISEDIDILSENLPDEAMPVLERLLANRAELACISACGDFKEGFRLGAQFTLAAVDTKKQL